MQAIDVKKIDHIHRYTEDKWLEAKWYEKYFGFTIIPHMEAHAKSSTRAPLDIINRSQNIIIALFTARDKNDMNSTSTIAMRVNDEDFIKMINNNDQLLKRDGNLLSVNDIIFHSPSHDASVYFVDPWGNSIEIITHHSEKIAAHFPELNHFKY